MPESSKVKLVMGVALLSSGMNIDVDAFQTPLRLRSTNTNTNTNTNTAAAAFKNTNTNTRHFMSNNNSDETIVKSKSAASRFSSLLEEVGLTDLKCIQDLPSKRNISCNDVFCNRELPLGSVRAIGFDMDYTIAQYKQPAFDKLAFDGAKAKLVKMGYPDELLDVDYDHTVRFCVGDCDLLMH